MAAERAQLRCLRVCGAPGVHGSPASGMLACSVRAALRLTCTAARLSFLDRSRTSFPRQRTVRNYI